MKQSAKDAAYRVYVTDTLKMITENTAMNVGGHYIKERFISCICPKEEETRTESEIIERIRKKIEEVR